MILLVVALVTFVSCQDPLEVDREEPRITSISVNGVTDQLTQNAGDTIYFIMAFSDNVELQKYRIQVRSDFNSLIGIEPFDYDTVVPLDGMDATDIHNVGIPVDALSGDFLITVEVMDQTSNVSNAHIMPLSLLASGMPSISLSQPNINNQIIASPGDTIPMTGSISDNEALQEIRINLTQESQAGTITLYNQIWTYDPLVYNFWSMDTLATDSVPFSIPTTAVTGTYLMEVAAFDTTGNYSSVRANIDVQ